MLKQLENCPYCDETLEANSEALYWHLKIHEVKDQLGCTQVAHGGSVLAGSEFAGSEN